MEDKDKTEDDASEDVEEHNDREDDDESGEDIRNFISVAILFKRLTKNSTTLVPIYKIKKRVEY